MDEKMLQILREAGVDVDSVCERFMGNMSLLHKFLLKFPDDRNYTELIEGLNAGDTDKAFHAAHALRGVCGNMSFVSLHCVVAEITELLRVGDLEAARQKLPEIKTEYTQIVAMINRL